MIINEDDLPHGWNRVIGDNEERSLVTVYTNETGWFDVAIRDVEGNNGYTVRVRRGPNHPRQGEIGEALREQTQVHSDKVNLVAVGCMLCASDIDPFTNEFFRGFKIE
jgi:hypothetical protein